MPFSMSGLILRRSVRYFWRSSSISGSVRHSWHCAFQYVFHLSLSPFVGRGKVVNCVPSCSLIRVSPSSRINKSQPEKHYISYLNEGRKRCIVQYLLVGVSLI